MVGYPEAVAQVQPAQGFTFWAMEYALKALTGLGERVMSDVPKIIRSVAVLFGSVQN
jgi:hypothetical protein